MRFDDAVIPKFFYGSHYSSTATVLYYLIRLEPFTTLFLQFQGGQFDHANRLFSSISTTWYNCLHASADVQELIPEFFYFPDFLRNMNKFDLGKKQDGTQLNDVVLPPWAKTPEEFVRINRDALESPYVSEHLHGNSHFVSYSVKNGSISSLDLNREVEMPWRLTMVFSLLLFSP